MPGAPGISLEQAAMAVEAVEGRGWTTRMAGAAAAFSSKSVSEILRGKGKWGELVDTPVFRQLRLEQKQIFQVASFELARQSLIHAEQALPKASYLQAVTGYAILRDKERLDAGEPTEIVGHIADRRSIESIESLAAALGQALIARQESNAVSTLVSEAEVIGDLK